MKKIINVIIWPVLYGIGQFIIALVFTLFYNASLNKNYNDLTDFMNTNEYKDGLAQFLLDNKILIVIIGTLIFLPIIIKKYSNYKTGYRNKLNIKKIWLFTLVGLLYSLLLNIIFFIIGHYTNLIVINNSKIVLNVLFINIVTTVIMGPFIEEYLFRGIVYNRLKHFNFKNILIVSSLIFSLFHLDLLTMIYAFIFNIVLIHFYEKEKNLNVPIIIHMSANLTTLCMLPIIFNLNILWIWIILILISLFCYFLYQKILKNEI